MLAQTHALAHIGANPHRVTIETDAYNGLPGIKIVGLPSKAIEEARERLRSAIRNSGLEFLARKYTINMAPADIAKSGTGYELAMAIGILVATKQITSPTAATCFIAELALDGSLRPAKDCLASVLSAQDVGFDTIVVDPTTTIDPRLCQNITIFRPNNLKELYLHYINEKLLLPWRASGSKMVMATNNESESDLSLVRGLSIAKRALEIAAAGHHNLLLVGPPGAGKTLLAHTLPTILPNASLDDMREIYYLHSLANQAVPLTSSGRPFRAPHHTASEIAIVGGGKYPRPGEISLAHHGVLFMDEFVEFPRSVLEALRQPIEDGHINISRAAESLTFPADVLLVGAMNPCPCGYYGGQTGNCTCPASKIERYLSRLSGPLLDRFDLICHIQPLSPTEWAEPMNESSSSIRKRVELAYTKQLDRNGDPFVPNSRLPLSNFDTRLKLSRSTQSQIQDHISTGRLSARGLTRSQKVARTIADLDGSTTVELDHLNEALYFKRHKLLDRNPAATKVPARSY